MSKQTQLASSLVGLLACGVFAADRTTISLNGEWAFSQDPSGKLQAADEHFNDATWQRVRVPHDWAISGPFNPDTEGSSGKLPWRGVGWYRRTFDIPCVAESCAISLDFDGVMASPEVYVNGRKAGGWDYGYMSFRVNATPFVHPGKNTLAVRADTRDHHSRWYPGAGIYRSVRLVTEPAVSIAHQSLFITTPEASPASARVHVACVVTNRSAAASKAAVTVRLLAPDGNEAAKQSCEVAIPAQGGAAWEHPFAIAHPALWDIERPALYTAEITVKAGGDTDAETTRFGIRTIAFPADDGFHLNGRRVQLYGVDLHSDLGPLGMAFNRSAMRRQLAIMKDMGANALRTSHNACDPQVLDLCDEMGIVVWNECFDKWEGTSGRRPDQNLEAYVSRNLRAFVRRDRNHPCVIVWSIGNEIPPVNPQWPSGQTRARNTAFRATIRELDTTRPVGSGNCFSDAIAAGCFEDLDITGWNYNGKYSEMKKHAPNKPVLYSESASALSSYGYYETPPAASKTDYALQDFEVGSYDHNAASWSDIPDLEFARMTCDTYCGGEFVWTGIDYLGEPTPYTWLKGVPVSKMARSSYFGICDLMGLPKDRFYLYRSHWNKRAVTVHILPHWNWAGKEGQNVPVYVYASGDEAELFLNGKSLGRRIKGQHRVGYTNLAVGKAYSASSCENGHAAGDAADTKEGTRWCAADGHSNEWWQVDFGKVISFGDVRLFLEEHRAANYAFRLLVSDDAKTWTKLAAKELGQPMASKPVPGKARYLRVTFDQLQKGVWASIRECLVLEKAVDGYRVNPYYNVCDQYRFRWLDVPYQPGELRAVAYDKGQKIGEAVMRTAGVPIAVQLTPESAALPNDNESVVFVQVDVVDAKGTRDPRATNRISFELTGPGEIVAVGNGNPRGYDVFTATASHPLYFGKAVAVLRRHGKGTITLTARAEGLRPGKLEINN